MNQSNIVAIGGGHGLATVLKALKSIGVSPTAIVSVADDGGSSGQLSHQYSIPAVGDIRRCIEALASRQSLLSLSLGTRFDSGFLAGHPLGNLLLAGLATKNDIQIAIDEICRILAIEGRILPAAQQPVRLLAETSNGTLAGQVVIEKAISAGIVVERISAEPEGASCSSEVVDSVINASEVLIGPGSFCTSILGALTAPNLTMALSETTGRITLISNITTEFSGTETTDAEVQVRMLARHGINIDECLAPEETTHNSTFDGLKLAPLLAESQKAHSVDLLAKALTGFISQD